MVLLLSFDGFNWFSPYGGISPYGGNTAHARHAMHNGQPISTIVQASSSIGCCQPARLCGRRAAAGHGSAVVARRGRRCSRPRASRHPSCPVTSTIALPTSTIAQATSTNVLLTRVGAAGEERPAAVVQPSCSLADGAGDLERAGAEGACPPAPSPCPPAPSSVDLEDLWRGAPSALHAAARRADGGGPHPPRPCRPSSPSARRVVPC